MAVKASATITLSFMVDVSAVYRYYKLQASTAAAPSVPTTNPPPAGWNDTEPNYTSGSTQTLYTVDCTVFANDTFLYSAVSKSSSYEAAKEAYNKALAAESVVNNLTIGGRNLLSGTAIPKTITGTGGTNECTNDYAFTNYLTSSQHIGKVLTISFYWQTVATSGTITTQYNDTPWSISSGGAPAITITPTNQNGYYSFSFILDSREVSGNTWGLIWRLDGVSGQVIISNVMLECSSKVSDWKVAPEDLDYDIADAAKTATNYITCVEGSLMVSDMSDPNRQFLANANWQSLANLTWEDLQGYTWGDADVGKNVLIDSDGVKIRHNSTNLASFGANAIEFDKAATFKADGVLVDNGDAFAYLGRNTILWTGGASGYWMNASQSITLSTNISRQISGAVFAWSLYQNGAAVNSDWHFIFVPKYQVANFGGNVIRIHDAYLGMNKILYVSNGNVSGHAQNSTSGTTNGIAWDNTKWVLRYIIGV